MPTTTIGASVTLVFTAAFAFGAFDVFGELGAAGLAVSMTLGVCALAVYVNANPSNTAVAKRPAERLRPFSARPRCREAVDEEAPMRIMRQAARTRIVMPLCSGGNTYHAPSSWRKKYREVVPRGPSTCTRTRCLRCEPAAQRSTRIEASGAGASHLSTTIRNRFMMSSLRRVSRAANPGGVAHSNARTVPMGGVDGAVSSPL